MVSPAGSHTGPRSSAMSVSWCSSTSTSPTRSFQARSLSWYARTRPNSHV
eukprot:CAMPEP_0202874468 /NCGR_PEP_ID=MMETSP1391-20130828/25468_1 /ASSEMBLY_ACC=CAM_ASM_000867 /TAXON_ID=1034604 /ORGANISM="Chlamydomonas leiostraca, Strain SAG 11-49" /LENGTH=49 /DNA_ID=CAMNT_0049555913 /DNA_START=146 /DNA_END=295 /DNA_ORIENTATION=+